MESIPDRSGSNTIPTDLQESMDGKPLREYMQAARDRLNELEKLDTPLWRALSMYHAYDQVIWMADQVKIGERWELRYSLPEKILLEDLENNPPGRHAEP